MTAQRQSEVHAYGFVKDALREAGWDVRNPLSTGNGQVFTQQECLDYAPIAERLGKRRPEYVVKLSESKYYVIETKARREKIDQALEEAEHQYARRINGSSIISAPLISGVAGNDEEGYIVKSRYLEERDYEPVTSNDRELTGLVSPRIASELLRHDTASIKDLPFDEAVFLKSAENINEILHNGAIPATERGKVMSALLLSLVDGTQPNLDSGPSVLVEEINARVNAVLHREGKPEFFDYIRLNLPSTQDNHAKYRNAIVQTIQELNNLNIRSAMNSGTDVLGSFYEVFLKYGNWAKEIGIVLTPRHITRMFADVLDIQESEIVYDPTCGTGGFLVAALDYVKRNAPDGSIDKFKQKKVFGIEQEPSIVALAIVNMIFRGDGKNNIVQGNCFHRALDLKREAGVNTATYVDEDAEGRNPPVGKVLMNPPISLKKEKEYKFVEHALDQLARGGLLFSVLPISEMIQKGQYRKWRRRLLEQHTLIAVITFPTDLFYPIGVNTCGVIIEKGEPHPDDQRVFWLRALHDGFVKQKGKRVRAKPPLQERDILNDYHEALKEFVHNPKTKEVDSTPRLCDAVPIDREDSSLELVPEAMLDDRPPTAQEIHEGVQSLVRQTAGYLMTVSDREVEVKSKQKQEIKSRKMEHFELTSVCSVDRKYAPYQKELESDLDTTPYISTRESRNGVNMRCDADPNFPKHTLTVALDGKCGTSFFQFEDFIAGEKTAVLDLREDREIPERFKPHFLLYLGSIIRFMSWRYHYGRKLSMGRLEKFKVPLPATDDGGIDVSHIKSLVERCYGWEVIEANI